MTPRTFAYPALFLLALAGVAGCEKKPAPAAATSATAEEDAKESFGRLTVPELEAKMAAAKAGQLKLAVFDNNTRERFEKGRIPGAKWVAFDKVQASDLPADKDATLVFYCANEH